MNQQTEQIWTILVRAGVVDGPAPELGELDSPWYVKTLLAVSAWLAALLVIGFVGSNLKFIFTNITASLITGGAMIGYAYAILRGTKYEFVKNFTLAMSFAGQALVMLAIFFNTTFENEVAWALVVLLQVPLAMFMQNFVHRVVSSSIAAFAFCMALIFVGVPYAVSSSVIMFLASWLWLNEFRHPRHLREIRAIGYGLVLALIPLKGTLLSNYNFLRSPSQPSELLVQPWMGEVFTGSVTLYVVWRLLRRRGMAISEWLSIAALLGTALLCAVSIKAQGVTVGVVILLLGFAGGNRVLFGLGITSLLFYISFYYYSLDATLLAKSQTLFVAGLILLATRWTMLRLLRE